MEKKVSDSLFLRYEFRVVAETRTRALNAEYPDGGGTRTGGAYCSLASQGCPRGVYMYMSAQVDSDSRCRFAVATEHGFLRVPRVVTHVVMRV